MFLCLELEMMFNIRINQVPSTTIYRQLAEKKEQQKIRILVEQKNRMINQVEKEKRISRNFVDEDVESDCTVNDIRIISCVLI